LHWRRLPAGDMPVGENGRLLEERDVAAGGEQCSES